MKTLLVTGGQGFIGSNFIRGFLKSHPQWKVLNFDKLTYCGNRNNTRDLEKSRRYRFIQGDICNHRQVAKVMRPADAVVHFAAETHVDRSIDNAEDFLKTNVLGTRCLLDAARRSKIKRFIHVSTDEVYGSIVKGAFPETAPLAPNSPYAASKAAGDLLVKAYERTYGYPVIIVRSSNNFGPYQFPEKIIPLFVTNLIEKKKVPLYARGQNRRDWLFVEDNCRAIELIFDRGKPGEVYNIGTGRDISNLELTRKILKGMGEGSDKVQYVKDRPGHDFRYSLNIRKIKRLGFRPRWSFDEGLKRTIDWYQKNRSWWSPLKKDKFTVK